MKKLLSWTMVAVLFVFLTVTLFTHMLADWGFWGNARPKWLWLTDHVGYMKSALPNIFAGALIAYVMLPVSGSTILRDHDKYIAFKRYFDQLIEYASGPTSRKRWQVLVCHWMQKIKFKAQRVHDSAISQTGMVISLALAMVTQHYFFMYVFLVQFLGLVQSLLAIYSTSAADTKKTDYSVTTVLANLVVQNTLNAHRDRAVALVRDQIASVVNTEAQIIRTLDLDTVFDYAKNNTLLVSLFNELRPISELVFADSQVLGPDEKYKREVWHAMVTGLDDFIIALNNPISQDYDDYIESKLIKIITVYLNISRPTGYEDSHWDALYDQIKHNACHYALFNYYPIKSAATPFWVGDAGWKNNFPYYKSAIRLCFVTGVPLHAECDYEIFQFKDRRYSTVPGLYANTISDTIPFIVHSIQRIQERVPVLTGRAISLDYRTEPVDSSIKYTSPTYDCCYLAILYFFFLNKNLAANTHNVRMLLGLIQEYFKKSVEYSKKEIDRPIERYNIYEWLKTIPLNSFDTQSDQKLDQS